MLDDPARAFGAGSARASTAARRRGAARGSRRTGRRARAVRSTAGAGDAARGRSRAARATAPSPGSARVGERDGLSHRAQHTARLRLELGDQGVGDDGWCSDRASGSAIVTRSTGGPSTSRGRRRGPDQWRPARAGRCARGWRRDARSAAPACRRVVCALRSRPRARASSAAVSAAATGMPSRSFAGRAGVPRW